MSTKRNHHVVPRLYLRGFTISGDEPFIWVYKRGEPYCPGNGKITNNPYRDSIGNAGVERDFYADPKQGGTKDFDSFENILETLEKPADQIFHKLRARQSITDDDKCVFSRYIILMERRVLAARKIVTEQLPETALNYEPSAQLLNKFNQEETALLRSHLKNMAVELASRKGSEVSIHNRLAAASNDSFLVQALQNMRWTFYTAPPSHAFATSDNPVFIPRQWGIGKNISELTFPIAKDVALIASWDKRLKEGFVEAPTQIAKEINRRVISQTTHNVYFSQNPDWVVTTLGKRDFKYRPIYAQSPVRTVAELIVDPKDSIPRLRLNKSM